MSSSKMRHVLSMSFAIVISIHLSTFGNELPKHAELAGTGSTDNQAIFLAAFNQLPKLPHLETKYDLVVYGATPGGLACAIRAAREGLSVLVVEHTNHIGGMFSYGLSVMDTLYAGARSPLYDEFRRSIYDHYRINYGPDSPQFMASRPGHPKTYFEAHVAESIFAEMILKEPNITVARGFYPIGTQKIDGSIVSVTFKEKKGSQIFEVGAKVIADCSYEADLAVTTGAKYRVGRESKDEFNEEHAGRIFLRKILPWPPENVDPAIIHEYKKLNLFHYDRWFEIVKPESTGKGDRSIQTYNIRSVLTTNPANRIIPDRPPKNYDAEKMRNIWANKPPYSQLLGPLPNDKFLWNMPEVIGPQNDYPEGDWQVREHVIDLHRQATAGMLYFLQNDPGLPEEVHNQWRELGFAKDEFLDSDHIPSEVYARETRRIVGKTTFTERDVLLADGSKRTPVHHDSIGVTEWFVDSHACSTERVKDSIYEGEIYLNYISHPAQVPYKTILPDGIKNLLVPVCLSATHVGWGAIRLEPCWMTLGESAAFAAVQSINNGVSPAEIDSQKLVQTLSERRVMVSFFNDIAVDSAEKWLPAIQFFGTQGFFDSYDAKPFEPLTKSLAQVWVKAKVDLYRQVNVEVDKITQDVVQSNHSPGEMITDEEFVKLLEAELARVQAGTSRLDMKKDLRLLTPKKINRAQACHLLYNLVKERTVY